MRVVLSCVVDTLSSRLWYSNDSASLAQGARATRVRVQAMGSRCRGHKGEGSEFEGCAPILGQPGAGCKRDKGKGSGHGLKV